MWPAYRGMGVSPMSRRAILALHGGSTGETPVGLTGKMPVPRPIATGSRKRPHALAGTKITLPVWRVSNSPYASAASSTPKRWVMVSAVRRPAW